MQWRQECCAGKMVAFFLLVAEPDVKGKVEDAMDPSTITTATESVSSTQQLSASHGDAKSPFGSSGTTGPPVKEPCSLPQTVFIRLWSQFHNMDYNENGANFARTATMCEKWSDDVERLLVSPSADAARVDPVDRIDDVAGDDTQNVNTEPSAPLAPVASDQSVEAEAAPSLGSQRLLYDKEVKRKFTIYNPLPMSSSASGATGTKRDADTQDGSGMTASGACITSAPKVNMLAPRKKKPKV